MTKRTELTYSQIVATANWLETDAEKMKFSTRSQRVDALFHATGVVTSEAQLARVEKELGFTDWRPRRKSATRTGTPDRVRLIAASVTDLYHRLAEEPPNYLKALVAGCSAEQAATLKSRTVAVPAQR